MWLICVQISSCHEERLNGLTGCSEDPDHQADVSVPQQGHVSVPRLRPASILLGLDGGPDADTEDQQVEDDGGHQTRDVQSHVDAPAAAHICCVEFRPT